jgi:hypothetical protein
MTTVPVTLHLRGDEYEVLDWYVQYGPGGSVGRAVEDYLEESVMEEVNTLVQEYLGGPARREADHLSGLCGSLHWLEQQARGTADERPWWGRAATERDAVGVEWLRHVQARLIPQLEATLRALKGAPEPTARGPVLRAVRSRRHAGRCGTR